MGELLSKLRETNNEFGAIALAYAKRAGMENNKEFIFGIVNAYHKFGDLLDPLSPKQQFHICVRAVQLQADTASQIYADMKEHGKEFDKKYGL